MMLRHGSLFSGIGGFDLAAEWCGWENVFHCEWNEFGQRVLKHYWPEADSFGDITKTDFTKYNGTVDIISGGFPCQPYSTAGKRLGKEDERHLWPEMLRVIREVQPRYVVGENVFGLLNWNGGLVFDEVHADLAAEGYETQAVVIPAAAVNAPHGRDRVWFVANAINNGDKRRPCQVQTKSERERLQKWDDLQQFEQPAALRSKMCGDAADAECSGRLQGFKNIQSKEPNGERAASYGSQWDAADADSSSTQRRNGKAEKRWEKQRGRIEPLGFNLGWEKFPSQSPICGGDDGLPTELDGVTFSKWRAESIKAYGNAIVPQVAYQIFKTIDFLDQNK